MHMKLPDRDQYELVCKITPSRRQKMVFLWQKCKKGLKDDESFLGKVGANLGPVAKKTS